ncbi:MAG: hypothetical protein LBU32_12515 [Clostridiales bacterium]|jgi:hypothetical protein|nr:hypothetical protein [Clostridiales bacterium]
MLVGERFARPVSDGGNGGNDGFPLAATDNSDTVYGRLSLASPPFLNSYWNEKAASRPPVSESWLAAAGFRGVKERDAPYFEPTGAKRPRQCALASKRVRTAGDILCLSAQKK